MSYESYNELASSLARQIKTPQIVSQLPDLISAAERDIWRTLRANFMKAEQAGTIAADAVGVDLTADSYAIAPRSLILIPDGSTEEIKLTRAPDSFYALYDENADNLLTMRPKFYAVDFKSETQSILFDSAADQDYIYTLSFWRKWALMALGDTTDDAPILLNVPDLLEARVMSWVVGDQQLYWLKTYKERFKNYHIGTALENRAGRPAGVPGEYF